MTVKCSECRGAGTKLVPKKWWWQRIKCTYLTRVICMKCLGAGIVNQSTRREEQKDD